MVGGRVRVKVLVSVLISFRSFSSTRTPESFSAGLLSRRSSSSMYKYRGLPLPKCSTLHLALLNLTWPYSLLLARGEENIWFMKYS